LPIGRSSFRCISAATAANPIARSAPQPKTFDRLHQPAAGPGEPYASGWIVSQRKWAKGDAPGATGRVLTHAGSNTFWFCVTWLAPERDLALLLTCNQWGDTAVQAANEAARRLMAQEGR